MGHGMGQVDEERLVFVFLHKIYCLLRTASGYRALIDGQLNDLLVLDVRLGDTRWLRLAGVHANWEHRKTTHLLDKYDDFQ